MLESGKNEYFNSGSSVEAESIFLFLSFFLLVVLVLVVIARLLVQLTTQILLGVLRPINGRLKESLDHVQERCCPLLLTFIIATSHAFPTFLFLNFSTGERETPL